MFTLAKVAGLPRVQLASELRRLSLCMPTERRRAAAVKAGFAGSEGRVPRSAMQPSRPVRPNRTLAVSYGDSCLTLGRKLANLSRRLVTALRWFVGLEKNCGRNANCREEFWREPLRGATQSANWHLVCVFNRDTFPITLSFRQEMGKQSICWQGLLANNLLQIHQGGEARCWF